MISLVDIFLLTIISFDYLRISSKLHRKNINFKEYKIYIAILLLTVLFKISLPMQISSLKLPIFLLALTLISRWLFKSSLKTSIIIVMFLFLLINCTDIIFSIIIVSAKIQTTQMLTRLYGIIILEIDYLVIKLNSMKKIINYIINNQQKNIVIFISILTLILYCFSVIYQQYYDKNISLEIMFLYITIILNIIFVFLFLFEKSELDRLNGKLHQLKELQEIQENFIKDYKIRTHEYANNLALLKSMNNNKKMESYIDNLLTKATTSDDLNFFIEVEKLPISIVKSFIICKYFESKKKGISLDLEVGSKVKTVKESSLPTKVITDIIDIIGVFIDNAIEEVECHNQKEFKINIFKNNQNQLLISIANKTKDEIINMEDMLGNTTKGQGHGYGLLLVQKIVRKNSRLKHTTEYISDVFIQNLIIDLKV